MELPHFGVINDSKTTPLRMVITGDAKDSGEILHERLASTRTKGDSIDTDHLDPHQSQKTIHGCRISKAFVQIQLSEEDRKLLVFRWPVKEEDRTYTHKFYRFKRMPCGISCSPFVLNAALRKLFPEHAEKYSED